MPNHGENTLKKHLRKNERDEVRGPELDKETPQLKEIIQTPEAKEHQHTNPTLQFITRMKTDHPSFGFGDPSSQKDHLPSTTKELDPDTPRIGGNNSSDEEDISNNNPESSTANTKKEDKQIYNVIHYQVHRETIREKQAKYYQDNREDISKRRSRRYQNNRKDILEQKADYYQNNRKDISEQKADYYQNNRETKLNQAAEYRKKNSELIQEKRSKRREANKETIKENERKSKQRNKLSRTDEGREILKRDYKKYKEGDIDLPTYVDNPTQFEKFIKKHKLDSE